MSDELIVSGISVNLGGKIPIPLNISIADSREPAKRQQPFSKEITLPPTQINMTLFSGMFSFTVSDNNVTFDATQKAVADYKKKGVSVLKNPILQLTEVIMKNEKVESFKCRLFAESVDYFLLLSTINVGELDWSEYNHILSRPNIKASFVAAPGSGYYYPLIERGLPRLGTTIWTTTDLVPYVYEREVLIKMFEWAEIPITSALLETDLFKSFLWGYGGGIINTLSPSAQDDRKIEINNGDYTDLHYSTYGVPGLIPPPPPGFPVPTTKLYYFTPNINPFLDATFTNTIVQDNQLQYDNGEITAQLTGNYNLSLSMSLDYQFNFAAYDFVLGGGLEVRVHKNGLFVYALKATGQAFNSPLGAGTQTLNTNLSKSLSLQSGDVVSFSIILGTCTIESANGLFPDPVSLDATTNGSITIDMVSTDTAITDGGTVILANYLPQMKCSDFLIGSIRKNNLLISEPDQNGVVTIESFKNFYKPTTESDDWTQLIDHDKQGRIVPTANDYKKNILFNYKASKDFDAEQYFDKYQEEYGNLDYQQSSYYAKGSQKISLPWSMIIPYEISPGILIPRFIKISDAGVVSPNKGPSRSMIRNGNKTGFWTFADASDIMQFEYLTTYPCVHHFDDWEAPDFDVSFKLVEELFYIATAKTTKNLFSENYFEFINEMTSSAGKLYEYFVKLNPDLVKNIDFSKLKMINGALFRLNRILEYDDNIQETTKVELIKVLTAKSPRRKQIISEAGAQVLGVGDLVSPQNGAGDVGIINGGLNTANPNSGIIFG